MAFDWKSLVSSLAPTIGAALGGPMGAMAVKAIADQVLGNPGATETEVSAAFSQGLSGDQVVALKAADAAFVVRMRELDIDVLKVNQEAERAYIADTADARKSFSGNENVFVLGVCILVSFAVLMGLVLVGCFLLMTGVFTVEPTVAALCAGLIGTVIGYVAANAQQVVSYFYGSSKASKDSGERVGEALTASLKASGAG